MNRLGFADFHAKHFSQEQQNYWSSILHQQQLLAVQGQSLQEINGNHPEQEYDLYPSYNGNNSYSEQYCNNEVAYDEQEIEAAEGLEVQEDYHFSKEAMAIFEFSENYRKELQEEKRKEEEEEEREKKNWQYGESSVLFSGGVEAPATCLVLTKPESNKEKNIRMKEDLLNSIYIASCDNHDSDTPVLFWPVIPLRL